MSGLPPSHDPAAGRPTARILVIRHGQSTWNAEGRWQGQADPPLTPTGEAQALLAAERLRSHLEPVAYPLAAIVTSDLQRAAVTASIIADELGFSPVALDKRLRERHAGEWQGLTRDEVERHYPGYLASYRRPPNFESSDSAGTRAAQCLIALAQQVPGSVALAVSHGGILRALRVRAGLQDDTAFANLSGQWFEVHGDEIVLGELVDLVASGHHSGEQPPASTPL